MDALAKRKKVYLKHTDLHDKALDHLERDFPIVSCTKCGATTRAGCNCGVAYVRPGQRAAEAIKQHPEKSARAIAAEFGIDHKTVTSARKATGENSPVGKRLARAMLV